MFVWMYKNTSVHMPIMDRLSSEYKLYKKLNKSLPQVNAHDVAR